MQANSIHSPSPIIRSYSIEEVTPYINWIYFFHAWGMEPRFASITEVHDCPACRTRWIATFAPEEQAKAREAATLYTDAIALLRHWTDGVKCQAICLLTKANSEGDDILIEGHTRLPLLRQQQAGKSGYTLCLSDFVRPTASGVPDTIGLFATAAHVPPCDNTLLASTLADRLAEATAERLHEEVRKYHWGYAREEQLTMRELHAEAFQGIRPAVGYPSLPDQSVNFILDDLLDFSQIDITLSDNGAMKPSSSVSGLMIAHPQAHYFAIGTIGTDQLRDYARRRDLKIEKLRSFLASNL
jgi:cobalamin-dependent methionine synthase I